MPAVIGIVGVSNSGKTTLIERLIPVLRGKGLRVGTLKHDAHGFAIDRPGKDTWRHREAGAEVVVISGGGQVASIRQVATPPDPLELIQEAMPDLDLVLVEGFKHYPFPKLEVVRAANSRQPICSSGELAGLVTDRALDMPGIPVFGLDDVTEISGLITRLVGV